MDLSQEQLEKLLSSDEGEHLECKEGRNNFSNGKLLRYCCALANEGGGKIVLGVTDKPPRQAVGTALYPNLNKIKHLLISTLRIRIDISESNYQGQRILVFHVPSRPIGVPLSFDGTYWMRRGEELVPMTEDMLKRIFDEAINDFSAQICQGAALSDLSEEAIADFRSRLIQRTGNKRLASFSPLQLLSDLGLMDGSKITFASLILLGKQAALAKYLSQAEVIFEYRTKEKAGPANQRFEFREGFFSYYEKLWELINLRNEIQHFQDGLFMRQIPTFSEGSIREAILNAISHRDYQHAGSVFIRQYPGKIEIISPGGFPAGINAENILYKQFPRNRLIAEVLGKCGLVERSGQGADRMFEEAVEQGKSLPDFARTDTHQVFLILDGRVKDPDFLKFIEQSSQDRRSPFSTYELLVLDWVRHGKKVPALFHNDLLQLKEEGILESAGRGKYLLSRKYYSLAGKKGTYTRHKGLDKETNRQLLLKHIQDNKKTGSQIKEFIQVLPQLSRRQILYLTSTLLRDGLIKKEGKTSSCRYYPI